MMKKNWTFQCLKKCKRGKSFGIVDKNENTNNNIKNNTSNNNINNISSNNNQNQNNQNQNKKKDLILLKEKII